MDTAIWEYAIKDGKQESVRLYAKIDQMPFDYQRRIMSVVVKNNDETLLISKGAPESIFARCKYADMSGNIKPISSVQKAIDEKFLNLSMLGYRILAVASRNAEAKPSYHTEDERDLTLLGLLIFTDPPKKDAHEAINKLEEMGVEVKILTGDNELVAKTSVTN
jgi:Mg2+-importing ATPase